MFRSVSLAMTVLAAGLTFGSSVGVYAPTIVPVDTLKPDEWKKYQPAALGSNTTGKIQAFYDMMCERVDLMSADYYYSSNKHDLEFAGCASPSRRSEISAGGDVPTLGMYIDLYTDMCNWLSYVPSEPTVSSLSGYTFPEWESRLCYDIGLTVNGSGITTRSADIYTFSLNNFGYVGTSVSSISNRLAYVASLLGIPYASASNRITAADIDNKFCRFVVDVTNAAYVASFNPNGDGGDIMRWAPLYAFDRICADTASRNVATINMSGKMSGNTTTKTVYTYVFNYDTSALSDMILSRYNGYEYGTIDVNPSSVTVTEVSSSTYTASTPWASVSIRPTATAAGGYINTVAGESVVAYSTTPSISLRVIVEESGSELSVENISCANSAFIDQPEFFDSTKITVIGKAAKSTYMADTATTETTNIIYHATASSSSAVIDDALSECLSSNSFVVSAADTANLIAAVTNRIGTLHVYVSGAEFSSYFDNGSLGTCRIMESFTMPYVICENKYNFTEWSGHISETTDAMDTIGPRADYEVGTIDAWVDASAAAGGDGSSSSPFQTIDQAITAVNPSGGTITKSGNVARIGIRPGTYTSPDFWNVYGMSSSWPHPAYNVQLVGVGEGVTINRDSKYITGYFEYLREQSSTVYLTNALSTVENVTFNMNSTNKRQIFLCLTFKSCKITGYMSFRNGGFASCNLYDCLLDDLTISKYSYQDTPGLAFFNGANCENCIIRLNSTQADAYVANKLSELTNCVLQVAQSRIQAETSTPGEYVFIDSTIQASNGVDTTTYPLSAENCIFFVDGMTENATYATGNIVTNSSLFSEVIDTHTYMPNDEYWQWRTHGFQTSSRTE